MLKMKNLNIPAAAVSVLLLFSILTAAEPIQNLIQNPSFEDTVNKQGIPKYWGDTPYDQKLDSRAFIGKNSLKIERQTAGYSIGAQIIPIDFPEGTLLVLLGYTRGAKIITGPEKWQGAKVQVIFLDNKNKELNEPIDIANNRDTFDWDMFIQNIEVPAGAAKIKILVGLWGASGTVWLDDFNLSAIPEAKKKSQINLLGNGGFEIWGKWEFLGEGSVVIKSPGYNSSTQALYVKNNAPVWSFARQVISLNKLNGQVLIVDGMVKCDQIKPGKQKWEKGRVYVEFVDAQDKKVGDWIEVLAKDGTSDWTRFYSKVKIEPKAKKAKFYFGLQNAVGEIVFDDLSVTVAK